MKLFRSLAISMILLAFVFSGVVLAKSVKKADAEKMVQGWLKSDPKPLEAKMGGQIAETEVYNGEDGKALYYVVYLNPSGFVIVSADDLAEPVVAFSDGDGLYDPSSDNPLGVMIGRDMPGRIAEARKLQKEVDSGKAMSSKGSANGKWKKFTDGGDILMPMLASISDVRVPILIQSRWNQSEAAGGYCYNYYTPNHYPCGCVATAFAQVVRYFQHQPAGGIGVHGFPITVSGNPQTAYTRGGNGSGGAYNWSDMVLVPGGSLTTAQREAIGALCYDCGVTVEMGYSSGGSGAYMHNVRRAMKDIYGYSNALITYHDWYAKDSGMLGMINPNLDAGLPVLFSVWDQGNSEHAIVCDGYGYQSSTMYHHINMGWGGSDDAWYNIPDISYFSVVDSITYNVYTTGTGEIISGRVTDGSGAAMSGVTVTATGPGGPYSATTNSRGIYALAKVHSNSTYTVSVGDSGCSFTPSSQNVTTGTSTEGQLSSGNVWGVNFSGTCTPLEILEYIGPNGTASAWETGANWIELGDGSHRVPTNADIARIYNELGLGFSNSNVTVSSTTAICQKLQLRYLTTKLTILTGGKLTTTGSVEMYQGDSSQLDIQAGATMDACTRANTTAGTFKLANDGATYGSDTVNVYGTLNIVSQNPSNGTSDLQICNVSGGMGTGTINVYAGGLLNVEAYAIGSYGTGRIYITPGGTMTIKGDVRTQVNADKSAHKIAGAGGAVITATYNAGENKTYVTAAGGGPPPAPVYEGYEPLTTGGEGGTVIWVNNLSEGSLAGALNSYGKRIVKFSVSGTIYLSYEITVTQPYLTIDGSSAPGNGITIVGWGAYRGIAINTHDVIVSNLRFRGFPGEGIQIFGDYNIIIDHCSVSGSGDGALDINGGTHDITVQWCLFGDCMEVHRCYGIRASLHHNLYHHNNRRQPKIFEAGPSYDFRNNVVEYWTNSGTNIVNSTAGVNVINNVFGPPEPGDGSWPLGFGMQGSNNVYTAGNYNPGEDVDSQGDLHDPVPEPNVTTDVANEDLRTYVRGKAGALPRDATDEGYAGPEVTDTTPPEAPTGLNVTTYSSNKLSLSWNANTDEEIANYNVYRSTSAGGTYTNVGSPAMNSFLNTGLSASTTYYYKISAVDLFDNESALSAYDSATTAAPDSTPPCVPSGLFAAGHDAFVTLDWEDCTDSDLEGYNLYRSTSAGGTYTLIAGAGTIGNSSSYTDNSVTNKVTYYYKVSSVDKSDNESAQCAYVSATPLDITPPVKPTGLTAVGKDDFVPLNWNDNPEVDIAGYNVYRSTTSGGPYGQIAEANVVPNSSYTDNNVDNYTVYYYVVRAVDTSDNESPDSNEASAMPEPDLIPPAVPSGVSATAVSCTRIDINWNDNTEEDLGSYNVYYSSVSGGPYTLLKGGLTVSAYSDVDLNPGTTRYYRVTAEDLVNNESAYSSQVSATTAQPNYYVDGTTGMDTNPGSSSQPWRTIGKAASTLTAGQTVLIRPGTYTETVAPANHGEDATPITYLADSAGPVIVQAASSEDYVFDMGKRCTVLSGLTIRNGSHGVYLGSYSRNCELRNCVIYNNTQDGIYTRNGYYKFHNCLIYENDLDGIRLGADPQVVVTKCTIVKNGEDGMEIGHLTDQVIDSIIAYNDEDGIEAGLIPIKYSDVWENSMNDYLGGAYPDEGTISEDPCFVNPLAGDYRLGTGSPCIGAASDGGNMGYTPTAKEYLANSPSPANGLDGLDASIMLSWSAGVGATSHDVYLGTSSSAVNNATRASAEFKGNQVLTSYDPALNADTTYYWRIDEVDSDAVTHKGLVWKFITKPADMPSANYYVDGTNGNDNNLGTTPAQAWRTIQKAANTVTAGKTVLVYPGTYAEAVNHTVNAGTSGSPIVYRAWYESGTVTINATGLTYGFRCSVAYVTLEGFEVKNSNSNGILITGDAADYCVVKNCKVYNNGADGIKFDAGDYGKAENCLIYDNQTNGIEFAGNADGATIDNCTIHSNNANDGMHIATSDTTVIDCIITSNTQWGIDSYGTVAIGVTYTNTWNNTSGSYDDLGNITVGTGCKSADPKFANPGSGDFHLLSGSPCRSTASDGGDMGYRYGGPPPPPEPPAQASDPSPADDATYVAVNADLSWSEAAGATSYDVYFGTSSPGTFQGNQTATTFDTGTMANNKTYYWRIDSKNAQGTTTGVVWNFTTTPAMPPANYYVDGVNGNDNNTGTTPPQAWKTIQKAANTLTAGQTVLVFPGTYAEYVITVNAGTSGNPIVYRAWYENGTVTINATGLTSGFKSLDAYVTFDGFVVYGANANGILISGDATDYNIVKNCKLRNNGADGVKVDAADYCTVQNCLIYDNATNGVELVSNGEPTTIDNCTIYSNNNGDGIHSGGCDGTVTDCIISSNTQWGIDSANTLIINVSYTDTWGNTSGSYDDLSKIIVGTGCKNVDPLFVNPGSFDFHLQGTSQCKNAASDGGDMGYRYP